MSTPADDARLRRDVSGTDLDAARDMFAAAYDGTGFVARQTVPGFAYRHTAVGNAQMSLRGSRFSAAIEGEIQPEQEYIVSWIRSGTGVVDRGRDEVHMEPGIPSMFPTGRPFAFAFADYEQSLLHIDRTFLESIAAEHEGLEPAPLRFDHTATPTGAVLARWRAVVSLVGDTVLRTQRPTPVLLTEMARLAAVTLLETFPHERSGSVVPAHAAATGRVREAVAFMDANVGVPLTTADVAAAVDLSVRGLQQAFQRQLGAPPTAVLRDLRLDRVRDDLVAAAPGQRTVADVARAWGFVHLGRFSASYASRFGEYPRDTLLR